MEQWKDLAGILGSLSVGGFLIYVFLGKLFNFLRGVEAPNATEVSRAIVRIAEATEHQATQAEKVTGLLEQCVKGHEKTLEATQENALALARVETLLSRRVRN